MARILLSLLVAALFLVSCGSETAQNEAEPAAAAQMTIAQINAEADQHEGELIAVEGMVDHVCRHGGKKMFIIGDNPEDRLKIDASNDVASFDIGLEGSKVRIEGTVAVLKVDEDYLNNWEGEVCSYEHSGEPAEADADEGKVEAEMAAAEEAAEGELKEITALRQQLAESDKDYLGFYSISCKSFEELPQ
ncbi:hypothetical protein GF377_01845 [candidate division GN15 bacterium]|nr:hypothetical protein [candidate division GN15 bacterium]